MCSVRGARSFLSFNSCEKRDSERSLSRFTHRRTLASSDEPRGLLHQADARQEVPRDAARDHGRGRGSRRGVRERCGAWRAGDPGGWPHHVPRGGVRMHRARHAARRAGVTCGPWERPGDRVRSAHLGEISVSEFCVCAGPARSCPSTRVRKEIQSARSLGSLTAGLQRVRTHIWTHFF